MLSLDLFEEKRNTIIEDAMMCGKSGGVVSSVPVLHATPGAFITHSNDRNNRAQMSRNFRQVNPSYVSGTCAGATQPANDVKIDMFNGTLNGQWTFLYQNPNVSADVSEGVNIVCFQIHALTFSS